MQERSGTLRRLLGGAVVAGVSAAAAMAGPVVIDGTIEGLYGAPVSVQDTQTQFGDSNLGQIDYANGSELDAAYAYLSGGVLYLGLAGNLESNFNKLEVFFDTRLGGQKQLRGDNPNVDFDGLNRMGDDGNGRGLNFDDGFEADYWMSVTGGGGPYRMYGNYAEILTLGGGAGYYLGSSAAGGGGVDGSGTNPFGINFTINNSNVAGVNGGTGAASGAGVATGVEMAIPLAAIGSPSGPFRITAFINGGGHDFVSNQVLAPIGTGANLGEPRLVNFKIIPGNQFFTVVPEPGTLVALLICAGAALRRR
jgi:hypothetical protein